MNDDLIAITVHVKLNGDIEVEFTPELPTLKRAQLEPHLKRVFSEGTCKVFLDTTQQ